MAGGSEMLMIWVVRMGLYYLVILSIVVRDGCQAPIRGARASKNREGVRQRRSGHAKMGQPLSVAPELMTVSAVRRPLLEKWENWGTPVRIGQLLKNRQS